jgi:hypothetical protein
MQRVTSGLGALLLLGVAGCGAVEADPPSESAPVECLEADLALEPTFDTPEDAVADALVTEASLGELPGSLDDYDRVERSEGSVQFEFREADDDYVVWSTAQDEDGQWGVVGVSACRPAD